MELGGRRWGEAGIWSKRGRKQGWEQREVILVLSCLAERQKESSKIPEVLDSSCIYFLCPTDSSLFFPFTFHPSCHHQLFMFPVKHTCSGKDKKSRVEGEVRESAKAPFAVAAVGWISPWALVQRSSTMPWWWICCPYHICFREDAYQSERATLVNHDEYGTPQLYKGMWVFRYLAPKHILWCVPAIWRLFCKLLSDQGQWRKGMLQKKAEISVVDKNQLLYSRSQEILNGI